MGPVNLDDILLSPLKIISVNHGDIFYGLKKSDSGYINFGEAYFSSIKHNSIKAWKRHTKMTMNLIVPIGNVLFVFYLNKKFRTIEIGEKNYFRITVPPGIWFGFKGKSQQQNLILNISDIVHNENEIERKDECEFYYDWSLT